MSSCRYTVLPIKEVSSPRSEILSPSESRYIDAPPSSEMSSSYITSCVSPDVMEGYLDGAILKPGRGAVFVRACSLLHIWRDIIAMVTVS